MAAKSSTRNAIGWRTHLGANSVRKIATPSASGTAITSASSEDANVPKIIGAAPNTPATGSQTEVHRKRGPNRRIAGQALTTSSLTTAPSSSGSSTASTVSGPRYTRSPRFTPGGARRGRGGAGGGGGGGGGVGVATVGSIGRAVMGRKRIRPVSRECNGAG